MKRILQRATLVGFGASALALTILAAVSPAVAARGASARARRQTSTPPAQGTGGAAAPQSDGTLTPRERRAGAYAKLLEGQRLFAAARTGGVTPDSVARAQQAFRRAAELDPTLSEARTALAEVFFFFLNDLEGAEREALAATRVNRDNLGAHRVLARVYTLRSNLTEGTLDRGLAERAVAEFRELLRLRPNDAESLALLGEFYLLTERAGEAVEAFRRWAGAPPPVETRFYQVVMKGGDLTPGTAYARLAEVLLSEGRATEALAAARGARLSEPETERARVLLGQASAQAAQSYASDSRFDEAVKVYEDLLKARGIGDKPLTDKGEKQFAAGVLGSIAELRRQAGQAAEASATVERMRRLVGADDPTADLYAVDLLRQQGKKAEALGAIRAARLRHPNDTRLLYSEAGLLAEAGKVEEATALFRARLKGGPEDYDQYIALANILIDAGRGREAVEAARKALELAPADRQDLAIQALFTLSSAHDRAGDVKAYEDALRQVLTRDPENSVALNNLGYFLTERNERLDEAFQMIQRAVRSQPANPSFLDSLGWVYFKLGKLEEAERYLRDAARRKPGSADIQEHLGDLLQRLGQLEEARAAWRKALALAVEPASTNRLKAKLNGGK